MSHPAVFTLGLNVKCVRLAKLMLDDIGATQAGDATDQLRDNN